MKNTVDKKEIEQFSLLSNKWWAKSGPFSALHKMSNARMEFIRQNANRILNKDKKQINLLDGIKCIDIGCGGGILSEKLKRLGANVTGIDASQSSINVAKEHSIKSRLEIDYRCISTNNFIESEKRKVINKLCAQKANTIKGLAKIRKILKNPLVGNLCKQRLEAQLLDLIYIDKQNLEMWSDN